MKSTTIKQGPIVLPFLKYQLYALPSFYAFDSVVIYAAQVVRASSDASSQNDCSAMT